MKTKIFKLNQIRRAAEVIKNGELVAFPTETVYGLGANVFNQDAIKKIFVAKGRPLDNPLIVHISKKEQLYRIAKIKPSREKIIEKLVDEFWPGPLAIILQKKETVPEEVTAGLNTIAIRMPNNKTALRLIDYSENPIAAPSANLSGKPSGTCFEHVFDDFNGKIAGIIKSKPCKIGIESTVIDLTTKTPVLLRPGGTDFEKLKKTLPDLVLASDKKVKRAKSPGMKYRHYSPKAKIILFEKSALSQIENYKNKLESQNKSVKVISPEKIVDFPGKLFRIFRKCDEEKIDYILISSIEERGIGLAVMNRLRKSASKIVK